MRNRLGPKKVEQINRDFGWLVGQRIAAVLTRGGTDHRLDLCLADGRVVSYYPNTGEAEIAEGLTHSFSGF